MYSSPLGFKATGGMNAQVYSIKYAHQYLQWCTEPFMKIVLRMVGLFYYLKKRGWRGPSIIRASSYPDYTAIGQHSLSLDSHPCSYVSGNCFVEEQPFLAAGRIRGTDLTLYQELQSSFQTLENIHQPQWAKAIVLPWNQQITALLITSYLHCGNDAKFLLSGLTWQSVEQNSAR